MATTQLDPKQLARLIAQAATTGARSERPTEQIAPMDLQVLRDQALTELVDSELDPRVVRALLSAAPSVDPPRPTDDTAPAPGVTPVTPVAPAAIGLDPALPLEVRGRRRHVEIAPIRKPPPVAIPRHLAVAPSPISRQRAIVFAAAVITLVLVLVLAR